MKRLKARKAKRLLDSDDDNHYDKGDDGDDSAGDDEDEKQIAEWPRLQRLPVP